MTQPSDSGPQKQSYTDWVRAGYSKLPGWSSTSAEPTEDQKKQLYNSLPSEQKEKQSYLEWVKSGYTDQYDKWVPWIEDKYLEWFGRDNKASYVTKDTLDKTKVTGNPEVDKLQGDVNNLVGNQVGKDGLLKPAGDLASTEGINRAERGGKDESGTYGGQVAKFTDPVANTAKSGVGSITEPAQTAGNKAAEGAKSAGGMLGVGKN